VPEHLPRTGTKCPLARQDGHEVPAHQREVLTSKSGWMERM
jgi:hypothetical protein